MLSNSLEMEQIDELTKELEKMQEPSKSQSPTACIFNFINSTLGSGVLTIPYIFSVAGYIMGPLISISFAVLALISFFMLKKACDATQKFQFNQLTFALFNNKILGIISVLMQLIFIQGALISYVVVIKDNMWFFGQDQELYRNLATTGATLLLILPLCFLKQLKMLKFVSYAILVVFFYITLVLAIILFRKLKIQPLNVQAFQVNLKSLFALSLSIHAYSAQYNFVNLYCELQNREKNACKVLFSTSLLVVCTYLLVGFFGYFAFEKLTQPDILSNLPHTILAEIANSSLLFFMICHFPLPVYAMRKGMESLIWNVKEVAYWKSVIISCSIVGVSLAIGLFVHSVDTVLDFTSTVAGGSLGFIFPALFAGKVYRKEGSLRGQVACAIYMGVGIAIIILAFGIGIYKWA
eukprot:EST48762.1 Amino acid transporter family protein [Spironucleus salmonicida]